MIRPPINSYNKVKEFLLTHGNRKIHNSKNEWNELYGHIAPLLDELEDKRLRGESISDLTPVINHYLLVLDSWQSQNRLALKNVEDFLDSFRELQQSDRYPSFVDEDGPQTWWNTLIYFFQNTNLLIENIEDIKEILEEYWDIARGVERRPPPWRHEE
jgi:hypothetical protein